LERILVLNGPNLNLLGERDPLHYGTDTLDKIDNGLFRLGLQLGADIVCYQSNHEGSLIDKIHEERRLAKGIIINPGALTHYSYALRDALEAVAIPFVEVHLSDINAREKWRSLSVTSDIAWKVIIGKGPDGYFEALKELITYLRDEAGTS
jgi:3-dehydroquinate dehydratase-2